MLSRRKLGAAVLAAVSVIGLAATAGAEADGSSSSALREFYTQRPAWGPCDFDAKFQCATIKAPLDYRRPWGERVQLAISRLKSTGKHRRGVLMALDGGPGGLYGHGRATPARLAGTPLNQVYDLVGFDPRGTGASTQLYCEVTQPTAPADSRPPDSAFPAITADARANWQACERAGGRLMPYFTTVAAARDIDLIRTVLGERTINYVGYGDATYIGAVYGTMFGRHLDRSVLDSSRNPEVDWRGQHLSQAYAIRDNVEAWANWAGEHDKRFGLGRSKAQVLATLEQVAAQLAAHPLGDLTRTGFDAAVGDGTIVRPTWDQVADLVGRIRAGDQQAAATLVQRNTTTQANGRLRWGLIESTTCEDDWPRNLATYYNDMRLFRDRYPYGMGIIRAEVWACAFRTYTPPERTPYIHRDGYPKGVVVHGIGNTVLRYEGGRAMADRLHDTLITVPDEGTSEIYATRGNTCVDQYVTRYLMTGDQPPYRTTCAGPARPRV